VVGAGQRGVVTGGRGSAWPAIADAALEQEPRAITAQEQVRKLDDRPVWSVHMRRMSIAGAWRGNPRSPDSRDVGMTGSSDSVAA